MRAVQGFGRWRPLAACFAVGAIAYFGLSLEGARAGKDPAPKDRELRVDSTPTELPLLHAAESPLDSSMAVLKDPASLVQNPLGSNEGVSVRMGRIPGDSLPIAPPVRVDAFSDEASMMRQRGELIGPWRPNVSNAASGGCPANNCTFDMDCDDCNPCTRDRCVITPSQQPCAGVCANTAITNGDGASACSDGVFCNGIETCQSGACEAPGQGSGTAANPDDQVPCTSVCAGGTRNGKRCAVDGDCTGGGTCVASVCNEDTNACEKNCNSKFCSDVSTNKGAVCNVSGDCLGAGAACVTGAAYCGDGVFCNGTETCGVNGVCDSPGDACGPGADCSELTCPNSTPVRGCFSDTDCPNGTANSCQDRDRLGCFRGRCCTKQIGCVVNADCDPDGPASGPEGIQSGGTCNAGVCSNIAANEMLCASARFSSCQGPNKGWYALGSGGRPVLSQNTCPIIDPVPGVGNVSYQCPKYSAGIAPRPTEFVVNVGAVSDSVCEGFTELGDDYTVSNASFLALETLVFAGGVADATEERIAFEFYSATGEFIEDAFFVSGSGIALRTVLFDPPVTIPATGFVVARAASAFAPNARVFWASTVGPPFVGSNDVNQSRVNGVLGDFIGECTGGTRDGLYCNQSNGNADCPGGGVCTDRDDVLAFELAGTKVPAPTGACCDGAGGCTQELQWVCASNPSNTFYGVTTLCNFCSDDSPNLGGACASVVDCRLCTAGTNAGNACTVPGDCPGSSCVGGPNDGNACTIPANCPDGVCTAGQCLGTCVATCATGSCCNTVAGTCLTGFSETSCEGACNASVCSGGVRNGLSCAVAADCGVFNGYGTDCEPNCCRKNTSTGADDCAGATPNVADLSSVSAVYLTVSGNNSGATGPDSCTANEFDPLNGSSLPYEVDLGWWERLDIVGYSCAFLRTDMCCSDPLHAPQWVVMWDRCPCEAAGYTQWAASENPNHPELLANSRGAPFCTAGDDNLWMQYGPLPAGSYYQPIYSAQAGAFGDYQLHWSVERCPEAACCYLRCEAAGIPVACVTDADCPGSPTTRSCILGECMCASDAECGGGGMSCEPACELANVLDCTLPVHAPSVNRPDYKGRAGTFLGLPNKDPATTFCVAGLCDGGSCCQPGGLCTDVEIDLVTPISKDDCDALTNGEYHGGTLCYGGTCSGGTRDGLSCNDNSLCENGTCIGTALQLERRTCPICEIDDDAHCQTGQGPFGYIADDSVGGPDTFGATSRIADDFVADESGTLSKVCLEGFYRFSVGGNCGGQAIDKFTVNVYANTNSLPGALIGSSATTIFAVGGDGNLFTHQLTLTTPVTGLVNLSTYWLEVYNDTVTGPPNPGGDDGCNYFWLAAEFGQGNNYAMQDLGQNYGPEDAVAPPEGGADMHFCINLRNHAPPEPIRACCRCQASGTCDSQTGDPCCVDASFYECSIEKKGNWVFSQAQCSGFTCPQVNGPSNDDCVTPVTVLEGTNTINNDCATDSGIPALDVLSCQGSTTPFKADVWFQYINTCPGDVQVDMCDNGNGAQDTVMAIYGNHTGTCPCPAGGTQIGDCSDDDCFWGGTGGSLVIPDASVALGDCLLVRVAGFFDDDGAYFRNNTLKITCQGAPPPLPVTKGNDDKCIGGTNNGVACAQHSDCPGGFCQVKNRFITGVVPATATANGIKVNIVSVDANSATTPSNYIGTDRWAGLPTLNVTDGLSPNFNAAKLQCAFVSNDWSAVGQLHLYGDIVVPASTYDVFNCATSGGPCSVALRLTTAKWGDVIAPLNVVNFQDIVSIVDKFQNKPTGPSKTRTKLTEAVSLGASVNFLEVAADVAAFQGKAYKIVETEIPATCP